MQPVKINLYISFAPEDRPSLEKLLRWLYPMRDEINIWFENPPRPPAPLPLPWQILLFWYFPPDPRRLYAGVLMQQLERAHIYLFLTSYHSLSTPKIEDEITRAVQRQIDLGDKYLRIFPVILSPSRWQETSRLARFKPLGPKNGLSKAKPEEDAYLELVEQLQTVIHKLKRNLDERKYAVTRNTLSTSGIEPVNNKPQPDIGEDPEAVTYEPDEGFRPPEWVGWVLLLAIVVLTLGSLGPKMPVTRTLRYLNVDPADKRPPEYPRENPLKPPVNVAPFPPVDDTVRPGQRIQK